MLSKHGTLNKATILTGVLFPHRVPSQTVMEMKAVCLVAILAVLVAGTSLHFV